MMTKLRFHLVISWSGNFGHPTSRYTVCIYTLLDTITLSVYLLLSLFTASGTIVAKMGSETQVIQDLQIICICAVTMLKEVCLKIRNGNISMEELRAIQKREGQMKKLCDDTSVYEEHQSLTSGNLVRLLRMRLNEYEYFKQYREQLNHILSHLTSLQLQGI